MHLKESYDRLVKQTAKVGMASFLISSIVFRLSDHTTSPLVGEMCHMLQCALAQ